MGPKHLKAPVGHRLSMSAWTSGNDGVEISLHVPQTGHPVHLVTGPMNDFTPTPKGKLTSRNQAEETK
jgi:hypothetical protein